MDRYLNSSYGGQAPSIFSRFKGLSNNTWLIIGGIILFIVIALVVYFVYIAPSLNAKYRPNSEHVPGSGSNGSGKEAELMFFYADWCPHCKAAKPIWNDLKAEYENKTIDGYNVVFTEVDCTEENAEVEKLMNQYNIEGYPTIKLIKDGQVIEYDAKPTKETLTKFLNTML